MFTHKYRFIFALLVSVYTYINTEICEVYRYFNMTIEWYYALLTITLITFLSLESNRLLELPVKKLFPAEKHKVRYKIVFFVTGSMVASILTVGTVFFVGMVVKDYTLEETIVPVKLNLIYCSLLNLLYHLINTVIFYFKEYTNTRLEAEELKVATTQAELQLIRSQVNPHFLFNNLNVLASLIMKNNAEANKFIEEFSKVYRYILSNHDKELVELRSELEFIKPYIFLLEKRFAQGLRINIHIDETYFNKLIIPASLQMLIENAIKHNVVSRHKPLAIEIYADKNDTIVVSNNLQEKQTPEYSTGIGLQNIVKRYNLVSNRIVSIDRTGSLFSVSIPLINTN